MFHLILTAICYTGYYCMDKYHTKVFVLKYFKKEFEAGKYDINLKKISKKIATVIKMGLRE